MRALITKAAIILATLFLGGCVFEFLFGDPGEGTVEVLVTDAPVDDVDRVRLSVTAMELVSDDRGTERFTFSPPAVVANVLDLRDGARQVLLQQDSVEEGRYQTLRLEIHGGDGESFVREDSGGQRDLYTPGQSPAFSGPEVLTVPVNLRVEDNETARLLVDIDLRRGLVRAPDGSHYVFLPALRFINRATAGSVRGSVPETDLDGSSCTSDLAADEGNAVYVYAGDGAFAGDVFLTTSAAPADASNPVTVTAVTQDSSGVYRYAVDHLAPGDYTLALTCQGRDDFPLQDDAISFVESRNLTLGEGQDASVNF